MHRKVLHIVSLGLLALATVLMLAPTVIPHHHDGDTACFCADHCSHSCDSHSHNHSTHTDTEAPCTLSINYYSSDIDRKDKIIECITTEDNDDENHHPHIVLCYSEHYNYNDITTFYNPLPYDDIYHIYHSHTGDIYGLRAPPVFS